MNSDFATVFELKLEVQNVQRSVWRRFHVPSTQTFFDLHCTIQNLLRFDFGTDFAFHVRHTEGQLKTFAIDDEIGHFAPAPQVAWLCRIADHLSLDGNRRADYLHDAVFMPWVCSIELEGVLPAEPGAEYPRCIAGECSVFQARGGTLGFNQDIETGAGLPQGFDPEFFDPAGVQFVDSREEQIWTTFLATVMTHELALEVAWRPGADTDDRHLVPMPAPFYDLLVRQRLLSPEGESDYDPSDPLKVLPVWFSKASRRDLRNELEGRKPRHVDAVIGRRLAIISTYLKYVDEMLKRYRGPNSPRGPRRAPQGKDKQTLTRKWEPFTAPDPVCPITLAAGIWRLEKKYQPVIICRHKDTGKDRFVAVKSPVVEREQPINAAQIAQLDLIQAAAGLEAPKIEMEARLFAIRVGYAIMPLVDMRDVAPADVVLKFEARMDEMITGIRPDVEEDIREGDPPIFKETFDRLRRAGYSAEEATNMMCMALVVEYSRQGPAVARNPEAIERALLRLPNFPDDP